MRNFKKILMVIFVFAFLTVGCVLLANAAEGGRPGTVAALNELVTAAEAETDAVLKHTAVIDALDYLYTRNIDEAEVGYAEAVAKANQLAIDSINAHLAEVNKNGATAVAAHNGITKAAEIIAYISDEEGSADLVAGYNESLVKALGILVDALDENIETTLETASNQVAVNRVKSVLSACQPYGEEDILAELKAEFAVLSAAQDRALAANYLSLDNSNVISNYDLPVYFTEDWETCRVAMINNDLGKRWTIDLKGIKNQAGIEADENGNQYYVHRYLEKEKPAASYIQIAFSSHKVSAEYGLVFEFDIATFGEMPNTGIQIEPGGVDLDGARVFPTNYFSVDKDGNILSSDGSVLLPNAFVKGQWLHVMIVFEPNEFVYKLYVAGQFIGQYDAKYQGKTYDITKLCFRLSGKPSTYGEIAYDNISIYSGTSYRNHDRFTTMTEDEKFAYYVNYLSDAAKDLSSKYVAYNLAKESLGAYWTYTDIETGAGEYTELALNNEAVKAAVDSYLAYDVEVLLREVRKINLDEYIVLVQNLMAIERNMDTALQRAEVAAKVTAFANRNDGLIDLEIDNDASGVADYIQYSNEYQRIVRESNYDINAVTFIRYIGRFESAPTLATKERHYARVHELVTNGDIDIELITNENAPYRENFQELIDAYAVYLNADAVVYQLIKENNSNKIVNCIDRIFEYDTEEEWLANREEMEKYLNIVSPIVLEKDALGEPTYDIAYDGIEEAIEYFNTAYAFFYALHQDEHVAFIQNRLELVMSTETYIEKMGYISVIERYINTNELNMKDDRIITLLNNLDTCKSELLLREEDYAKILVQNAVYFNNIIERMRTAETYAEQRAYFEEAALLYFYIDGSNEGTAKAVAIYDEYAEKLDRIAESSIVFIEAVAIYNACQTEDEKYAALVECYYNAQFVEMSYEGAKEAMAEYQAAYDAYMGYAETVNADVVLSGNAVGSLRANSGIIIVIAVIIKKIFGV